MEEEEKEKLSSPMWSDSLSNLCSAYACQLLGDAFGRLVAGAVSSSATAHVDDPVDLLSDAANGHNESMNTIRTHRSPSLYSSWPDAVDQKWFVRD